MIGFSVSPGIRETKNAPNAENTMAHGNKRSTISVCTAPDLWNTKLLTSVVNVLPSLFVPSAVAGGKPTASNAGIESTPPPPTTASANAAAKPAQKRNNTSTLAPDARQSLKGSSAAPVSSTLSGAHT